MSDLANELREALNDPRRHEWGGPWEHLGDAERDVRVLLDQLEAAEQQVAALREALERIAYAKGNQSNGWAMMQTARAALAATKDGAE